MIASLLAAPICLEIRNSWLIEIVWVVNLVQAYMDMAAWLGGVDVVAMTATLPVTADIVAHA
jgi:hypothetical protein